MDENSSESSKKSENTFQDKEEKEDDDDDVDVNKNSQIKKVFIYNNNRHLPKTNSACAIRLFYEPYYSDLKNNRNNSKQVNNSKFQVEYIDLPKIKNNHSFIEKKLLQEPTARLKIAFPNKIFGRYNGYNNVYNNNYGRKDC